MHIIGLTGGTGAGKTTALKVLRDMGALALDCDEIYHELLSNCDEMIAAIEAEFRGVATDGKINRRKLAEIVWNDPPALLDLNSITHEFISDEINRRIRLFKAEGGTVTAVDAIALIESGQCDNCDVIVGITAPAEMRAARIMDRDDLPKERALLRIKAQKPESFYIENCDHILENTYDTQEEFEKKCVEFFDEIIQSKGDTTMSKRAEIREKIDDWFEVSSGVMIDNLSRIIEINSVRSESAEGAPYGVDSRAVLALAQKMFEDRGFKVSVFEDMMITVEYGPAPPIMGILAHLDIVAVGDGWDTDPLKLTEKDGMLYGRGVQDNKGPSIAAMYALLCARDLFPEFQHGVQIILGSGEETGFDDVTQYLKKNKMPPNVFTPDAEYPVVNIEKGRFMPVFGAKWEKETELPRIVSIIGGKTPNVVPNHSEAVIEGISAEDAESFCRKFSEKTGVRFSITEAGDRITITAEGEASHASKPERGNNAQTALIEILAAMPFADSKGFEHLKALNRLFPHGDNHGTAFGIDMCDEKTGKITVNFGVLRFSEYELTGTFDSRTPSCADDVDLVGMTKESLAREGFEVTFHEIKGCHHTPEETPFVQKLLRLYEEYTGNPGHCTSMGGLTYVHDIPGGVAFGVGMPGDDNRAHGANEYINKEQLITSAKMFAQAIIDMCCVS